MPEAARGCGVTRTGRLRGRTSWTLRGEQDGSGVAHRPGASRAPLRRRIAGQYVVPGTPARDVHSVWLRMDRHLRPCERGSNAREGDFMYGTMYGMAVKTTVYIPEDLKRALEVEAAASGLSEARIIREAIAARVGSARPAVGFLDGEPIAERVDELLEGFGE